MSNFLPQLTASAQRSSFAVRPKQHAFGVRVALGATTDDVMRMVLGEAFALAGSYVPARRATRVDPMAALRAE